MRAEEALMKQPTQEPIELTDDRPAKAQRGDVKTNMDDQMKDVQVAAIPSFCRNRTAEALSSSMPTFRLIPKRNVEGLQVEGCHPNPTALSIINKIQVSNHTAKLGPFGPIQIPLNPMGALQDPWISLQNYSTETSFALPRRQCSIPCRETKRASLCAVQSGPTPELRRKALKSCPVCFCAHTTMPLVHAPSSQTHKAVVETLTTSSLLVHPGSQ